MISGDLETSIQEIANHLKEKKSRGQPVGLFLGHRAGGLFNDNLYRTLNEYCKFPKKLRALIKGEVSTVDNVFKWARHLQSLDNLSAIDKFSECYRFLGQHCSEYAIYTILRDTITSPGLNSVSDGIPRPALVRDEDELLAGLIRAGFFETIITTNIDTLLEDGFVRRGLKMSDDYRVITGGADIRIVFEPGSKGALIVKIFGDLFSQRYKTVGNEFDLEADQDLKRFVVSELAKDVIMLGYDALWDWPIERAFREKGGMLWYVNEEQPAKNSHLAYVLDQRRVKFLLGPQGRYRYFLRELYNYVGGEASLKPEAVASPSTPSSQSLVRKNAFISYSHNDKAHLERLRMHLKGYLHTGSEKEDVIDVWDDTKIVIGRDWQKEISDALAKAKVAVLLVSADFMGSDFIRQYELPPLLQAAQNKEILLIPVVLSPCAFSYTQLANYQAIHPKPLLEMSRAEQEMVWTTVAEKMYKILNDQT